MQSFRSWRFCVTRILRVEILTLTNVSTVAFHSRLECNLGGWGGGNNTNNTEITRADTATIRSEKKLHEKVALLTACSILRGIHQRTRLRGVSIR
jgi:hypothetical protein